METTLQDPATLPEPDPPPIPGRRNRGALCRLRQPSADSRERTGYSAVEPVRPDVNRPEPDEERAGPEGETILCEYAWPSLGALGSMMLLISGRHSVAVHSFMRLRPERSAGSASCSVPQVSRA